MKYALRLLLTVLWLASGTASAREGEFDQTFGNYLPGRSLANVAAGGPATNDAAFATLVTPDGRILAAGGSNGVGLVLRFTPSGVIDTSFGSAGFLSVLPADVADFTITALAALANGQILLGGNSEFDSVDFVVCRMHAAGTLDADFGSAGCAHYDFGLIGNGNDNDSATAIAVDAQGRILLAGTAGSKHMAVVRFTPAGVLDTSFAANGRALITRFEEVDPAAVRSNGVAIQVAPGDGSIVLAGTVTGSTPGLTDFGVAKLDTNGLLVAGFGNGGVARVNLNPAAPNSDYALAAKWQSDGRIVIAGYSSLPASDTAFAIVRLTAQGALDPSFAGDGRQLVTFYPTGSGVAIATDVLVQADGRIVVGGYAANPANAGVGSDDLAVVRLVPDGGPDTSFGNLTAGRFTGSYDLGGAGWNHDRLYALALQRGKVIAVGEALRGGSERDVIAIRLTDAALFGNGFESPPSAF